MGAGKNRELHREGDKPAVIDRSREEWYKNGVRHRDGDFSSFYLL